VTLSRSSGLDVGWVDHLLGRYGGLVDELLAMIHERPELGEPLPQLLGVLQQANGDRALQQHRPGIEALLHGHNPDAGAAVALQ
jgi:hypothetical protein